MPRAKSSSRTDLVDSALKTFFKTGYHVVYMREIVRETEAIRGGIYSDFKGKEALFHACLQRYQDRVIAPVFAQVEAEGAGLDQHLARLSTGCRNALANEAATAVGLDEAESQAPTEFTQISMQGLWCFPRTTADVTLLRQYCETFLDLLQTRLHSPKEQAG